MAVSKEMRQLARRWGQGGGWPKFLEWIEIDNIRGWKGHRIEFNFPIVAIVGENGSGKSTILQSAAAIYRSNSLSDRVRFASDFFPDTPWDQVTNASIQYGVREGTGTTTNTSIGSVRKPTNRWRGNPDRRLRTVNYIDLSRIQPLSARSGYQRLAKAANREQSSHSLDPAVVGRLSHVMGTRYDLAKLATSTTDPSRLVPVVRRQGLSYSGFHQGAGEVTATELLGTAFQRNSLVVIDEIESSLHPRAQRRLVRDLATLSRLEGIQFIISTHSPYVLEEVPPSGRICILDSSSGKTTVTGVSPQFAMTRMDDENHPDIDIFVEDREAATLLAEIIVSGNPNLIGQVEICPCGPANVAQALGQMVKSKRFPRKTMVFADGDQSISDGVDLLPGEEAPERMVFADLQASGWAKIAGRIDRPASKVIDELNLAMTRPDHHDWLSSTSDNLIVGSVQLWQVMCSIWANDHCPAGERDRIVQAIQDKMDEE
jgi:predicted ATPase